MQFKRTPDACFEDLPNFNCVPHYIEVDDNEGSKLRMHYVREGDTNGQTVLLLHGEPSWSFLYRHMIPILVSAGFDVIAPDLIGFGRSDKPTEQSDYSYQRHVDWLANIVTQLDLNGVTLVCQDWGGLLGLRLVAMFPDKFARICAANTFLPTGEHALGEAFENWKTFSQNVEEFPAGGIIKGGTTQPMSQDVVDAYNAPFPDETYKAGARVFPLLVPNSLDNPASKANLAAWEVLTAWHKPFLTAFSDSDPVTAGGDKLFQKLIPGCKGQDHTVIKDGGHFLQEDQGPDLAQTVVTFINKN